METWDAIRARRNVRAFSDRPIAPADLERILEAGRRSPSSMNQQGWDLVAVTDRDRLRDLAGVWRYAAHVATSAATVAVATPASEDSEARETFAFDAGQVTMSMMLAAADLGIGSCHASVGDQDLAREILGLPAGREVMILVSFGEPSDRPLTPVTRPDRRTYDDVVHLERW
jgi:nitroreductase